MLEHHRRAPLRPNRPQLRRRRLLRLLHRRWDHRLTLVVGGAGFGKTTLLGQALDENRLAPRGDDLWVGCVPGDADALTLVRGIAGALGAELPVTSGPATADVGTLAQIVADAMWRRAPRHVCLVLDDVHHVPAASAAAALLEALLDALPANGHLVLASRQEPPLASTRHAVQGHVVRVGEDDLAFDADDLAAFASLRGVRADQLDGVGGWPALVELRALGHPGRVDDFLVEEILRDLTDEQRWALAAVAAIGGGDRDLFVEATGRDVDLATLLDGVPLVAHDEEGWVTIHPVWSSRLAGHLDPEERTRLQGAAGNALLPRDFHAAMDLLLAAGDTADIERALRRTCHAHRLPASTEGLRHVYERLPAAVRDGGLGELLAGMTTAAHDLRRGIAQVERALRRCAAADDEKAVLIAIEYLSIYYHWMEDTGRLRRLRQEFIDALPLEDRKLTALADALIADTAGDAWGVIDALRDLDGTPVPEYWGLHVAWLRATARLALGYPEAAWIDVEVAVKRTGALLRGAMSMRLVDVLFMTGDHEGAFDTLDRMIRHREAMGNAHTCCLGHCQAATLHALVGRADAAGEHAHRAALYAGPRPVPPAAAAVLAARAMAALAGGDEEAAARLLHEQRHVPRVSAGRQRYGQLRRLPLHYVLEPETRSAWDTAEVGPCYALARDLGQALVALREAGDLAPAVRLTADHWAGARAFLPVGWQVELGVAAAAGGSGEGRRVVAQPPCAASRPTLRRLAESPRTSTDLRRWALTLLDVPVLPAARLRIDVLGPARLRRDGRTVDHPHWRRQRVRALLLYLVARRGGTREEIGAALWPDLPSDAAARNLRVTLSYLLAVLEPDRGEGEPSCFVHTRATSLQLADHDWLSVDAWEMEGHLDRARDAERAGEPSAALRHLLDAVDLYRGPYLAEVGYESWALPHRDRLAARFVAAAVHAGELTLAAGDPAEALRLASRALEGEPYSEPAHRLAIAAHLAEGDLAAARRAFDTCRRQLDDLGLGPSEELRIIERSLHALPGTPTGVAP